MALIHWLSRLLGSLIVRPPVPVPIRNDRTPSRSRLRLANAMSWIASAGMCLSLVNGPAWGQAAAPKEGKGTIVAAGFGYQIGDTSTITVKVYNAATGEVLSDDAYELNVKEESSVRSTASQGRIFAGGVGLGATDLSNFVLRVYDAQTGKFQWEGQLNLTPHGGTSAGQKVSTVVPRRATITKIHATASSPRQPSYLLRALDASTGGLLWEDEFSTDGGRSARGERIANRLSSLHTNVPETAHTFDFRIRVFDPSGRSVLWEDQVEQQEVEEEPHEAIDDHAHMLPAWPRLFQQDPAPAAI